MKKFKTFILLYLLINFIGAVPFVAYYFIFKSFDEWVVGVLFLIITFFSVFIPAMITGFIGQD